MTNDELREVVEKIEKIMNPANTKEGHETEAHKLVRKLITLAQTVIDLGESCPKEKVSWKDTPIHLDYKDGYNQARADMLLWVAGKLGGLEELLTTAFFECAFFSDEDDVYKISQDIRQLFGVKEGEK